MESFYLLIPLVFVFTVVALLVYSWAVKNGQYDDLDKEAEQLLFDNDDSRPSIPLRDRKGAAKETIHTFPERSRREDDGN